MSERKRFRCEEAQEWPWTDGSCPLCHSTDQPVSDLRVVWREEDLGFACIGCVKNMRNRPPEARSERRRK